MIDLRFQDRIGNLFLDIAVSLRASRITGVLGPSGAGKSTLLRFIAGLHCTPISRRAGYVRVGERVWHDGAKLWTPCHRRNFGMVFQDLQLFAHLNVRDNLLFPLCRRRASDHKKGHARMIDLMKRTGLEHLQDRRIQNLSGGEAQRVALVRALVTEPDLLLLDEPLSGLDASRRLEALDWLGNLCHEQAVPVLYVSHHIEELARLADTLLVMDQGRVVTSGSVQSILATTNLPHIHPEPMNLLPDPNPSAPAGRRVSVPASSLLILPRNTKLPEHLATALTTRHAVVTDISSHDSSRMTISLVTEDHGAWPLVAVLHHEAFQTLGLTPGMPVDVAWSRVP